MDFGLALENGAVITKGDLEKLKQPAIAGIFGVNSPESDREQNGIIGGKIWGACQAMSIFRDPLVCDSLQLECDVSDPEIIVTKIIALAKAGEHNADRLVESSTIWQKTPRPNSPPVGTSPSRTARTGTSVGVRAQ